MKTIKIMSQNPHARLKNQKFWINFWFWFTNLLSIAAIFVIIFVSQFVGNNYSQYWAFLSLILGIITVFYNKYYENNFHNQVEHAILNSTGNPNEILKKLQKLEEEKVVNSKPYKFLVFFTIILFLVLVVLFVLDETLTIDSNLKLSDEIEIISSISLLAANHFVTLKLNPKKFKLKIKQTNQKIKQWKDKYFHFNQKRNK